MNTGEVIRYLRKQKGMTQDDLAKALGIQKTTLQKYERNVVKNLKAQTLRQLCIIFNVPPWFFVFPEQTVCAIENKNNCLIKQTLYIAKMYSLLNAEGRERLFQYIEDISENKKYRTVDMKTFQLEHDFLVKAIEAYKK